ncbi:hypothetical protein NNRS527_00417 [Nitrosospira sp. NRS527]|nr:hypothetical protein NNRS527_00417 [Nitrosospira sp. NRS527]
MQNTRLMTWFGSLADLPHDSVVARVRKRVRLETTGQVCKKKTLLLQKQQDQIRFALDLGPANG